MRGSERKAEKEESRGKDEERIFVRSFLAIGVPC